MVLFTCKSLTNVVLYRCKQKTVIRRNAGKVSKTMCTDNELRQAVILYNDISNEYSRLEKEKKALSEMIISELDSRKTDTFDGFTLITERLSENATKAGKQALKDMFPDNIDDYIHVSYSRYINSRNAKKIV